MEALYDEEGWKEKSTNFADDTEDWHRESKDITAIGGLYHAEEQ